MAVLFLPGCRNTPGVAYSFFVAGHAYGSPGGKAIGLHPPFVEAFPSIRQNEKIAFGVLTGDIVRFPNEAYWEAVQREIRQLNCKVHLAPGNHDVANKALYNQYYPETYYAFGQGRDLCIVLDGNLSQWKIEGGQLAFLTSTLHEKASSADHIFVFVHQLIWWEKDSPYGICVPNSFQNMADSLNFHREILPLLQALEKPVFIFAGDVGVYEDRPAIFCHKTGNVTLVASGMGDGKRDHFLLVEVLENKEVAIKIRGLHCESGYECLGKIEDYCGRE